MRKLLWAVVMGLVLPGYLAKAQEVKASMEEILKAKTVVIEWPSLMVNGEKRMFLAANATTVADRSFDLNDDAVRFAADNFCRALNFSGVSQFEAIVTTYNDKMASESIETAKNGTLVADKIKNISTAYVQTGWSQYGHKDGQPFAIFKMLRCKR